MKKPIFSVEKNKKQTHFFALKIQSKNSTKIKPKIKIFWIPKKQGCKNLNKIVRNYPRILLCCPCLANFCPRTQVAEQDPLKPFCREKTENSGVFPSTQGFLLKMVFSANAKTRWLLKSVGILTKIS